MDASGKLEALGVAVIKTPRVDDRDLKRALRLLNQLEPGSTKALRTDLKSALANDASIIAGAMPNDPPLSGFGRYPGWGKIKGDVRFAPSRRKINGSQIISIQVKSTTNMKTKSLLFTEFAGTRTRGQTASGRAMIRNLNAIRRIGGNIGRFAYPAMRLRRKEILKDAQKVLDVYMKKVEKAL